MAKRQRPIAAYERSGRLVSGHVRSVNTKDLHASPGHRNDLRDATVQLAPPETLTYPHPKWYAQSEIAANEQPRSAEYRIDTKAGTFVVQNDIDTAAGTGSITLTPLDDVKAPQVRGVHPQAVLASEFLTSIDYRRADLRGTKFGYHMAHCDMRGAILDDARFASHEKFGASLGMRGSVRDTSFDGASCVNASFVNIRFLGTVTFRGANLTGVDFSRVSLGAMLSEDGVVPETSVDFTDSNVTGDQIDQILRSNKVEIEKDGFPLKYRRFTFSEVCDALDVGPDDLAVMVWAGDVEVRDNDTGARVTGVFRANRHHVPQWGLARVL
jgi:uncharacterized protein YjbI with pentapeptide repeats